MERLKRLAPLLGFVLFALALGAALREIRGVRYHDIVSEVSSTPVSAILGAVGLSFLSYLMLIMSERISLRFVGRRDVPWSSTVMASFVGNVVAHNVGFSFLSGTPIRLRVYSLNGFSGFDLAKLVALNAASFWTGLLALGGLSFLSLSLDGGPGGVYGASLGIALLLALSCYIWTSHSSREIRVWRWRLAVPSPDIVWSQLLFSVLDWMAVAGAMYLLLPDTFHMGVAHFCAAFLGAQFAGMISQVPGGLGVFEGALLVALGQKEINHGIIASLVLFRFIYYFAPLGIAALALGVFEVRSHRRILERARTLVEKTLLDAIPVVFSITVFLSGVLLLVSGATPTLTTRLLWLERLLPLPILEVSHLTGSVVGVLLIALSRGLARRLDLAWLFSMLLLGVGAAASLLKGVDYEEASALVVQALLLAPCRNRFFRRSQALGEEKATRLAILLLATGAIALAVGVASYHHADWSSEMWWTFAFQGDAPRFLRASLAIALTGGAVLLWDSMSRVRREPHAATLSLDEVQAIAEEFPTPFSPLAFTGDKEFFASPDRRAFIMFQRTSSFWIALGDPVGNPASFRELTWEFREAALRAGAQPAFYQVQLKNAHLYIDLRLSLTKLGEEALVPLRDFSLEGAQRKDLRRAVRSAENAGMTFEIVSREDLPALLPELRSVSDSWLLERHTREKGFSLGQFDEAYLRRFRCAVVRDGQGIVAFANLWEQRGREELSIDLMRHRGNAPRGLMDFLFARLMLWGRAEGYSWFNLGVAPLSGMENRPGAPVWNRIAAFIYSHGERFYNFHGLRSYKEKFSPEWRPTYLAGPGGLAFPRVLADVTLLIGGGIKGVIAR